MPTKLKNQLIQLAFESENYFEVRSQLPSQIELCDFIDNSIHNLPTILVIEGIKYLVEMDTYGYVGYEMYTFTKIDELVKISLEEL